MVFWFIFLPDEDFSSLGMIPEIRWGLFVNYIKQFRDDITFDNAHNVKERTTKCCVAAMLTDLGRKKKMYAARNADLFL